MEGDHPLYYLFPLVSIFSSPLSPTHTYMYISFSLIMSIVIRSLYNTTHRRHNPQLVRWLAEKAEELGVEIYPGFAADEVLYREDGSVRGVATKDVGIAKSGEHKETFTRGIELVARQTLFAEGCRGSCSEEVIGTFDLRKGKDVQSYGLGIKEVCLSYLVSREISTCV